MRAAIVTLSLLISEVLMAQSLPQTTAESSHYLSTSRYEDVVAFVGAIQRADADVRVETFATTNEGRARPGSQRHQPLGPTADGRPPHDQRLVSRLCADVRADAQPERAGSDHRLRALHASAGDPRCDAETAREGDVLLRQLRRSAFA